MNKLTGVAAIVALLGSLSLLAPAYLGETEPSQTAGPPATAVPPDTIVAGFYDANSEIYTVAPDGGRLTRITGCRAFATFSSSSLAKPSEEMRYST